MTLSQTTTATAGSASARPRLTGPVIAATDGTEGAAGALRAAAALSAAQRLPLKVIAITEPPPLVIADYGLAMAPLGSSEVRIEHRRKEVEAQLSQLLGDAHGADIDVQEGDPAGMITKIARDSDACVIVLGLGHHDLLRRLMGGEVALQVLRMARVPVWAVPSSFTDLPRRMVVACDFGEGSQLAAQAALELFKPTQIHLLHVAPRLDIQPEALIAGIGSEADLEPAFADFIASLDVPIGVTVEKVTRNGKPSSAVIDYAKLVNADVIISGSRGGGFLDRIMIGSTATGIVRGAECSVLAVPVAYRSHQVSVDEKVVPEDDEAQTREWTRVLEEFSRRNSGRSVSLEVNDPELGAQSQVRGYPFLGGSYDHNDRRIELMLGEMGESERHLSRGITDVRSVDVMRDPDGRDRALRIAHGEGQTLLLIDW